jgi:hypothetical protein
MYALVNGNCLLTETSRRDFLDLVCPYTERPLIEHTFTNLKGTPLRPKSLENRKK